MKIFIFVILLITTCFVLSSCERETSLKEEVLELKEKWGFEFPLPSENDSINLMFIQMEEAYFTLQFDKMDSLAIKILEIDSTFYMALSFQAFGTWPFDLEKLEQAKEYSSKDTSVQRLIFGGDYSYWIKKDTVAALQQYTEVFNRYPNSKIAAWLAGMASLWAKDYETAIKYYNRSLEIDPNFYHAYYDLGETYLEDNNYKKSIENFKEFLKHHPTKYRIYKVIGDSYKSLNDSINSRKYYSLAESIEKKENISKDD